MKTLKTLPFIFMIFWISILFSDAGNAMPVTISGTTMDTFYHIKVVSGSSIDIPVLKNRIDRLLSLLEHRFSMYVDKSELSLFNRTAERTYFKPSSDFLSVLKTGRELYDLTDGAWDGTIKPLVDLWGFGVGKPITRIPDSSDIQAILSHCGFDKIIIDSNGISKTIPGLSLDLGSIAKGYGVDRVAGLLKQSGYHHFLVEIGGEIYASGTRDRHSKWKVGIRSPDRTFSRQDIHQAVALRDMAIATSGGYRNFITIDQQTFSHIIDPATGFPVSNHIAGASVIAQDCTFADGLATALMVMPPEKGMALVNQLDDVEAMIIINSADNKFETLFSSNFRKYLAP